MKEVWKDIYGYPGCQVSSIGRVRVLTASGYKIKRDYNSFGYRCVHLKNKYESRNFRVHRLVGFEFIPNPEKKPFINHINGIRSDNRVENLEWCTQSENMRHYVSMPNARVGGNHEGSALTNVQARQIKMLFSTGRFTRKEIGGMYGVSMNVIYFLLTKNPKRQTYKNAKP